MKKFPQVKPALAGFTTAYGEANQAFNGGDWSSSTRRPQIAEALLPGPTKLGRISIAFAGTDMTTDRARIVVRLRTADGGYVDIQDWREVTIGRGYNPQPNEVHFSNDFDEKHPAYRPLKQGWALKRNALPPQVLENNDWPDAIAIQIAMEGHGWFGMKDVRFYGEVLKPFTPEELKIFQADYAEDLKVVLG